jgi:hypothetical protein
MSAPPATVIENLEDLSVEEVMEQFDVTRQQIIAVLDFVAQSLKVSAPGQPSTWNLPEAKLFRYPEGDGSTLHP